MLFRSDIIAESLDNQFLLFGEVKWEKKTNIKSTISKLKKSVANFPKQINKKIIMAVWCKNYETKNYETKNYETKNEAYWIISPRDVLTALI